MTFYKSDDRNKLPINKILGNGIEILMEFSEKHDELRPTRLTINKYNHEIFPPTEIILKEVREKLGYSITYSEYIDSKHNTWETKIISSLKSKYKK